MSRPHPARASTLAPVALLALASACVTARRPAALPAPPLAADSVRSEVVAPGVVHRTFWLAEGPWVVHALDVDRSRCWVPTAWKQQAGAAGRATTSASLASLAGGGGVAAVNADFFSFAPAGVPQSAYVWRGRVVAGPAPRPVAALDSAGRLHVATLRAAGLVVAGADTLRVTHWNRLTPRGVALVDFAYASSGERVDSARAGVLVRLAVEGDHHRVVRVDTAATGASLPDPLVPDDEGDWLLVVGREAPADARARAIALARFVAPADSLAGTTPPVEARVALAPFHPVTAVGGVGVLLREGAVPTELDSAGNASFRGRHPRTAVGWSADQRRLVLAVVDGRQPGYSVGMTLPELANTMRALGAADALNLDGGGSSAMAIVARDERDTDGAARVRVVNRPSDGGGERPVGNILAITRECAR